MYTLADIVRYDQNQYKHRLLALSDMQGINTYERRIRVPLTASLNGWALTPLQRVAVGTE